MLERSILAWNVLGSSTHKPELSSWIKDLEAKTGLNRAVCSYNGCTCAEDIVRGSVWLKCKGAFVAPICRRCNHWRNFNRARATNGDHSSL